MNVFVIPSWYPSSNNPAKGIFVKEQVKALAENYPDHNFYVSYVEDFFLSLSEPGNSSKTFARYRKESSHTVSPLKNLTESYSPKITWTDKLKGETGRILTIHNRNFLDAQNKLGKIDLIHAHVSFPGGYTAMRLKEKHKIPYIVTEHMGPFPFGRFVQNGKLSGKIKLPLDYADKIIAVSSFLSEEIRSFGIKAPVVIPNMVNEQLFIPDNQQNETGTVKFLTVCSLSEDKGIRELLNAIKNVFDNLSYKSATTRVEFTIIGNGVLNEYVKSFINDNGLSQQVKLVNSVERNNLPAFFQKCDVFILPSRVESFGIVYIEAMSCGKPVIATDCGGPSDFVKDFNGKLTPVNDIGKLTEDIFFMVNNASTYSPHDIRKFAVDNFSKKVICHKIMSLYKEVTS